MSIQSVIGLKQYSNDELMSIIDAGLDHCNRGELLIVIDSLVDRLHQAEKDCSGLANIEDKLIMCKHDLKICNRNLYKK